MRLPSSVEVGNRITAKEAAEQLRLYQRALWDAIDAGTVRGERIEVGTRVIRLVDLDELREDLLNLPRCGYVEKATGERCDRPVLAPGGIGCSGPHARALETKGKRVSVETRRRMSAAQAERHRRADEMLAELNSTGYMNLRQVAADRHVEPHTVSRWVEAGYLRAERHVALRPLLLVHRDEFTRFNREEWPRLRRHHGDKLLPHYSPRSALRWQGRKNGSKGAPAGIDAGRAKGGRRRRWGTDDEEQARLEAEIRRLDAEGESTRDIAERVLGDRALHMRVWRFLNG
jgi:hypothetical protein